MINRIFSLFTVFVLGFSMLTACGGNENKEASVPTIDVTFEDFKKKWTDDLETAEGEGISPIVTEQIDISNLKVEKGKFKKELMKGFTLQGEVAENDKITTVSLTSSTTEEDAPEEIEKVIETMQGAFMSYGLLIKSVNPDLKEEDKPFEQLGIVDENGELVSGEEAEEEKSVVIKNVKYTKTKDGIRAEPASENG